METEIIIEKLKFIFICEYMLFSNNKIVNSSIGKLKIVIFSVAILIMDYLNTFMNINNYILELESKINELKQNILF